MRSVAAAGQRAARQDAARWRCRARAAARPSSRSTRWARRRGCRTTVSTSSSRSRSGDCTRAAKVAMVLGSSRSRLKAVLRISEVIAHQPGHGLGLRGARARAAARAAWRRRRRAPNDRRRGPWRCRAAAPRDRAPAATAILCTTSADSGCSSFSVAVLDLVQDADGADRVLVDRVDVIHVVLHLRDDAAEIGHEAAEHAGLVQTPQRRLRIVPRGQHLHEQAVGLGVGAQPVDQADVLGDQPQASRGWMSRSCSCATWNRRRIATGSLVKASGEATARRSPSRRKPSSARGRKVCHRAASLGLRRRLSSSAAKKMRVRSPTVLAMQEVVLHEALDAAAARPVVVAQARGDLALQVEGQPLLGAAGEVVEVAAHRPQEVLGALEVARLLLGEHALADQLAGLVDAIEIFGDPEQRVQVAQPALALLDVGLDDVARIAHALVALVALGELGLDEVAAVAGQELLA